MINST